MPSESGAPLLDAPSLALALLLALVPLLLFRLLKLKLSGQLLVALARMVLQLGSLGLVLEFLFRVDHWSLTLLWYLVMQGAAAHTILSRVKIRLPRLGWLIGLALAGASSAVLAWCLLAVLRPDPLWSARLWIPLGGMILGNSMNGITLALERHLEQVGGLEGRREWETLLSLGAEPAEARRRLLARDLRTALLPTLNTTATIGLVSIPGMMTGQMLGGSPPSTAILYQGLIMLAILASVSLSSWLAVRLLHARLVDADGLFRA